MYIELERLNNNNSIFAVLFLKIIEIVLRLGTSWNNLERRE